LEHILATALLDQDQTPSAPMNDTIPIFHACFHEAGVTNDSDFVSISPSPYGTLFFSTTRDATTKHSQLNIIPTKHPQLNIIQIKKLSSLFSWFYQLPAPPPATCWFELTDDLFRSWRTHLDILPPASPAPAAAPSISAMITDFCMYVWNVYSSRNELCCA
jgi:hypothetical protein